MDSASSAALHMISTPTREPLSPEEVLQSRGMTPIGKDPTKDVSNTVEPTLRDDTVFKSLIDMVAERVSTTELQLGSTSSS